MASGATSDKKKETSSDKKKTKEKKSSSDKPSSSSTKDKDKDRDRGKDRRSKKPTSSTSKSKKLETPEPAPAGGSAAHTIAAAGAIPSSPPLPHDPDAVQLFRRYDRARAGVLTRVDFLQLLKDYASPLPGENAHHSASTTHAALLRARKPLSLTDTSGIPLGYERSDRNSEFEAGQLFERYDRDRAGALTLDKFHIFFADFRPQLTAFVEDLNYHAASHSITSASASAAPSPSATASVAPSSTLPPSAEPSSSSPTPAAAAAGATASDLETRRKELRTEYQRVLWKLRKLCKHELLEQRERILEMMTSIRSAVARQQREHPPSTRSAQWQRQHHGLAAVEHHSKRWGDLGDSDQQQAVEWYEALETDLECIDEIGAFVRRSLRRGTNVSSDEIDALLPCAHELLERAQLLVMQGDAVPRNGQDARSKSAGQYRAPVPVSPAHSSSTVSSGGEKRPNKAPPRADTSSQRWPTERSGDSNGGSGSATAKSHAELTKLLRVKDQMIYELLCERTELRKQKAAIESYVQELSDVSAAEMHKWSRLTDDMQAEIERLRSRSGSR